MKKSHHSLNHWLLDIGFILLGSIIYAISVDVFTLPNKIAPGGATGLATVFHYLFHFPVGISIIVINIPLFVISVKYLGKSFFC